MTTTDLTLNEFRAANLARADAAFPQERRWNVLDWTVALSGEVGELCNFIKKARRHIADDHIGEFSNQLSPEERQAIEDELADIFTYLDLLAHALDVHLPDAIIHKFNEVSDRKDYAPRLLPTRLELPPAESFLNTAGYIRHTIREGVHGAGS
jgi:NTP pyrophosphatase (non-canonical NTP hydrolase)